MALYTLLELILAIVLLLFAWNIFTRHKKIWADYVKHYKTHKNPILHAMFRPNKIIYVLHVYVIAPIAAVMGVLIIVKLFITSI